MFRTATAIAVAALFCAPAMAQTLTVGQYKGTIQITGVLDSENLCSGGAAAVYAFKAGNVSTSVATVAGLGAAWTESVGDSNPSTVSARGTNWQTCVHSALPAATAFSATTVGTSTTEYVATPTANATSACSTSGSVQHKYTVTSANATGTTPQTNTVTVIPVIGNNSGFQVTTTNSAVAINNDTICYVSTDALYLYTQ